MTVTDMMADNSGRSKKVTSPRLRPLPMTSGATPCTFCLVTSRAILRASWAARIWRRLNQPTRFGSVASLYPRLCTAERARYSVGGMPIHHLKTLRENQTSISPTADASRLRPGKSAIWRGAMCVLPPGPGVRARSKPRRGCLTHPYTDKLLRP